MSCQQVSRFITTTPTIITTTPLIAPKTTATTPAAVEGTTESIKTANIALNTNPTETAIAASTAFTSTTLASLATAATAEDQDPYVFTESVPATPPILFNAQKSRIRHIDSTVVATAASTSAALPTTTATIASSTSVVAVGITKIIATTSSSTLSSSPTTTTTTTHSILSNVNVNNNSNSISKTNTITTTNATAFTITDTTNYVSKDVTTLSSSEAAVTADKNVTQFRVNSKRQTNNNKTTTTTSTSTTPAVTSTSTMTVQHLTLTSPPPSPPSLQQQQQQHHHHQHHHYHHIDTKSMSPNCNIQLTPSLWQTPLLLDTKISNVSSSNMNNNNNNTITPIIVSENAAAAAATTTNSPMNSPRTTVTSAAASILATTPPALIGNCIMSASCATLLPPSNFHHTTLAQHLHNVECIKKPPKRTTVSYDVMGGGGISKIAHKSVITPPSTPPTPPSLSPVLVMQSKGIQPPPLTPLQTFEQQQQKQPQQLAIVTKSPLPTKMLESEENQHSDSDINEIPVNVIFRKPQQQPQQQQHQQQQQKQSKIIKELNKTTINVNKQKPSDTTTTTNNQSKFIQIIATPMETTTTAAVTESPTKAITSPTISSVVTNYKNILQQKPTLIMPCTKVDIDAAVSSLQNTWQQKNNMLNLEEMIKPNTKIKCEKQEEDKEEEKKEIIIPHVDVKYEIPATKTSIITKKNRSKNLPLKQQYVHNNNNNNNNVNHLATDHGNAVAVVKMSIGEIDEDTNLMACETILPYCVQQHWLATEDTTTSTSNNNNINNNNNNNVLSREERIAQHKTLLRRQALQLLNTHTLQKLPLLAARKRLMCVDRLLRKYDDHDNKATDVK